LAKDKSPKTPANKHPFQNFLKPEKPVFEESAEPRKKRPTIPFDKRAERPKSTAFDERVKKRIKDLEIDKEIEEDVEIEAVPKFDEPIRLNKYLAHAGVASRRKADEYIAQGKVKVNGVVVLEMGHKVMPNDKVTFENKLLNPEKKVYILLNKPKDCITTTNDEKDRKTVLDLIKNAYDQIDSVKKPRLYPVGRLDRNTSGVLLITNDGELAQNLTHPSREIRKIYHVFLDKNLTPEDYEKITHGVVLEDGIASVDELAYTNQKDKKEVGIQIHNGKNRIVRRIFESLGYEVVKLDRVFFGGLTKKDLPRGRWRFLEEEEVRRLKHFTN
jgi:23S rRNA pseudouridine2605 synthase